jgi:hypothetical protein
MGGHTHEALELVARPPSANRGFVITIGPGRDDTLCGDQELPCEREIAQEERISIVLFPLIRWSTAVGREPLYHQPANSLRPARQILLSPTPIVDGTDERL